MTETLGQRITRLRTEAGMSQGDLADALDISRQSVSKWETDTSTPELEKLIRLAELFDISMDTLILGKEEPLPFVAESEPILVSESASSIESDYPKQSVSKTQRIVGLILIGFSVFFSVAQLVLYGRWGFLVSGMLTTAPIWGCGILCLCIRRHLGLWCAWMVYVMSSMNICYATGMTRGVIWNGHLWSYLDTQQKIPIILENVLLFAMYLLSFFFHRDIRCPIHLPIKKLTIAYIGCIIGYILFFTVLETWLPQHIIKQFFVTKVGIGFRLNVPDWLQVYTFIASVIDIFWLLSLILGARMLYNEHKAAKNKIA